MRDDLGALRETQGFPFEHENLGMSGVLATGPISNDIDNSLAVEAELWSVCAHTQRLVTLLDKEFKFLRFGARKDIESAIAKLTKIANDFEDFPL